MSGEPRTVRVAVRPGHPDRLSGRRRPHHPLLSALAERHGPVDVVTTPAAAPLLETHPAVRRVIRYDKRGADRGLGGLRRLAAELRRAGYAAGLSAAPLLALRGAGAAGPGARSGSASPEAPAAITYTRRVTAPAQRPRGRAAAGPRRAPVPARRRDGEPRSHRRGSTPRPRAGWRRTGVGPGFVALAPGSIWGTKRWPYYRGARRRARAARWS